MNTKVFLIAAEPMALRKVSSDLSELNAVCLQPFACVIPWTGKLEELRKKLSALGDDAVIAELEGGDFYA